MGFGDGILRPIGRFFVVRGKEEKEMALKWSIKLPKSQNPFRFESGQGRATETDLGSSGTRLPFQLLLNGVTDRASKIEHQYFCLPECLRMTKFALLL